MHFARKQRPEGVFTRSRRSIRSSSSRDGISNFGYEFPGFASIARTFNKEWHSAVFRLIPSKVLTCEDLKLPAVSEKIRPFEKRLSSSPARPARQIDHPAAMIDTRICSGRIHHHRDIRSSCGIARTSRSIIARSACTKSFLGRCAGSWRDPTSFSSAKCGT